MYESFFDLKTKPFELLPNPDFIFLSKSHKKAITYLDYGIRERMGFILLTGEVGSGKTTIIRNLINKHHDQVVLSKVFNTKVDSDQLIAMINDDFGLPIFEKNKVQHLRDLNAFLIDQYGKGNRPVLIIDEAQNLTPDTLEEVRMLSNLETDNAKLLQIILVGQPELWKKLASPGMLQFRQRISINCHLHPLTCQETEQYILHRLEKAGNQEALEFQQEALDIIFRYSRGIPRLINIICDFLLLSAFAEGSKVINGELAREIVGDLDFETRYWGETDTCIEDKGSECSSLNSINDNNTASSQDVKELLQEISRRIAVLEEKAAIQQVYGLDDIQHMMEKYTVLKKDCQEKFTQVSDEHQLCSESEQKKTNLFRKLFRAV